MIVDGDFSRHDLDEMQLPDAAVDGVVVLEEEEAYRQSRFGGVPASGKAIAGLQETIVREASEAECAVCLQDFEAGNKLRMMPCSHSFHEHCIFDWLPVSHVCPFCSFPLPTEQQQQEEADH